MGSDACDAQPFGGVERVLHDFGLAWGPLTVASDHGVAECGVEPPCRLALATFAFVFCLVLETVSDNVCECALACGLLA